MNRYLELKNLFEEYEDKENAIAVSKYRRNLFPFYGIPTPKRKSIYKDLLKEEKKQRKIDWQLLDWCYQDEHREFRYFVYDYLLAIKEFLTSDF